MYAAECDEKDDQTTGVTKKAKSATHVTLQPLSKMGEKNTQQPLISIGSGTSNGKDQGSSNGKDQGSRNDKGKSVAIMKPTILLSTNTAFSHTQMGTTVNNNTPNESNHQKKIEEIKTAHEVQMAERKGSHQQDMAKIEDAHHKDMAIVERMDAMPSDAMPANCDSEPGNEVNNKADEEALKTNDQMWQEMLSKIYSGNTKI
ncbi:hypothetical protein Cgig2_007776 [Carnegiea gigantea]|uniref:Uncharacterized protein n=1 Tax=Carnegiea gigantea TaxID=171969 RepID=A0A9Q1GR13_9CARY|nr:hypothetical protein Cgig2_007776 [Carnegiea gigantea]